MTSRMRELIQQLGEAIHESVIENEQIAGVVKVFASMASTCYSCWKPQLGLTRSRRRRLEAPRRKWDRAAKEHPSPRTIFIFSARCASSVEGEEKNAAEADKG